MRPLGFGSLSTVWMGSDFDGAFAQFVKAPASEVFPVDCDWTDAELGAVPCAAGTAENMLCRARVATGDRVLVTGASGGVGSALVQLARRRGARVVAAAAAAKAHWVLGLGAERVVDADADLVAELGEHSVDVVADNVAGPGLARLLDVLARGGRYVSSGAVAGPRVAFDKRIFYLKDLTLFGCTAWDEPVFADVVAAVEAGDLRPVVGRTFPLTRIADAQLELLARRGSGKIVLVP
jgi:NADPH:quinone reductase-like Zn-dependent oxidoreductase